jgi:fructose-specific phosphotransferase system IIC component
MTILAAIAGFLAGVIVALLFTWWALGELMGGVKSFWTGK